MATKSARLCCKIRTPEEIVLEPPLPLTEKGVDVLKEWLKRIFPLESLNTRLIPKISTVLVAQLAPVQLMSVPPETEVLNPDVVAPEVALLVFIATE